MSTLRHQLRERCRQLAAARDALARLRSLADRAVASGRLHLCDAGDVLGIVNAGLSDSEPGAEWDPLRAHLREIGSRTSTAKAAAARRNGRLGGRPRKSG